MPQQRSIPLTDDQMVIIQAAMNKEQDQHLCRGEFGPGHYSGFLDTRKQTWFNKGCESNGRQLTPELVFTGYSHCSCDTCF